MAIVKFFCDSGANAHSCREETLDTVNDLGLDENEWESYSHVQKREHAKDWAYEQLDIGYEDDNVILNKLKSLQNKRVIVTMNTGARYKGILHNSSDSKIVLSQLCIIHKSNLSSMSGSNEKRSFDVNKIVEICNGD